MSRRWTRQLVFLGAMALSVSLGRSAQADPNDEQAARALFREGLTLHEKGSYQAALDKFYAAYQRWKNPKILANIGTAAWELGRYVEAANAYDRFLAETPEGDSSRREVERAREDVLKKVGTLRVLLDSNSGSVNIDSKAVEATQLKSLRVTPGHHVVELVRRDSSRTAHGVDVPAGSTVQVDLTQGQPSSIIMSGAPGQSPYRETRSGTSPPPSKSRGSALPWVIGGGGVVCLIASGVFYSTRQRSISHLEEDCIDGACPDSSQDDIDSATQSGILSLVTLGVGVAALGTATYMLTLGRSDESDEKPSTTELGLVAGPMGAAGRLRVRF